MKTGVPKEIKNNEARVAITPEGVTKLIQFGHTVALELNARLGSGFTNEQYQQAGATLVTISEAWNVDLLVKVKEPQKSDYLYLANQMVFTFFHLSGVGKSLTQELVHKPRKMNWVDCLF